MTNLKKDNLFFYAGMQALVSRYHTNLIEEKVAVENRKVWQQRILVWMAF